MKQPEVGRTTGRIVLSDRTGYGPLPFAQQYGNTLYLRLSFGATIWNGGEVDAAVVTVKLPEGFSCYVPDNGAPDLTLPIFSNDLGNDGYFDNARGVLSTDAADGKWSADAQITAKRECIYKPAKYQTIYEGMVAYVKVRVVNPGNAMSKLYEKNIWTIQLSCKGSNTVYPQPWNMVEQNFISLAQEKALGSDYWAGNAPVLDSLRYETIQPTDFRRSSSTYTDTHFLNIFFLHKDVCGKKWLRHLGCTRRLRVSGDMPCTGLARCILRIPWNHRCKQRPAA
jgi:hypothetical protein